MALFTRCDGCQVPLRNAAVTVHFATVWRPSGSGARPDAEDEYLLCNVCSSTLEAAIRSLRAHGAAPSGAD